MDTDIPYAELGRHRSHAHVDGEWGMAVTSVSAVTESKRDLLSGGITVVPPATMPVVMRESSGRFRRGAPSPNPSGRAAVAPEVKEAARAHTADMLAVLVHVAMDSAAPSAARVSAANAVLDRGHGKPVASLEAKVSTVDFTELHLQALRELSAPSQTDERV